MEHPAAPQGESPASLPATTAQDQPEGLMDLLMPLAQHWGRLVVVPLLAGSVAVGGSFLVAPIYTATTTLLPPQQQQSAAAGALASLGVLAGLAGGGARSPGELYVSLMLSTTTTDRLIDEFKLMEVYDVDKRWKARRDLLQNVGISVGKKDGLITVSVEDESPQRAADIANRYVAELRRLTSLLAVTEAQERRQFFETQLQRTKDKLTAAQVALQSSGFTVEALRAEPKAAAESYAKLRAELTTAEVRLQAARGGLTDAAPEARQLQEVVLALRAQLAKSEASRDTQAQGPDYVSKYREFKYQEVLFELMARQFELARVDESREGALIQVVDVALPPERKTRPKRSMYGLAAALGVFVAYATFLTLRFRIRRAERHDEQAYARWLAFKASMRL